VLASSLKLACGYSGPNVLALCCPLKIFRAIVLLVVISVVYDLMVIFFG